MRDNNRPSSGKFNRRRALGLMASGVWLARSGSGAEPAGTLHVRVADETGATIPCSVALRDSAGALAIENRSYTAGFRSNGEFQKELPAGRTLLTVTRGFDFIAERRELTIRPGERTEVEVRLRRRSPISKAGWACGDHHVHMTHGESRIRVDFDYMALAARSEGLDYLSVCQAWNLPNPTAAAAEAECRRVSTRDCLLAWNLEAPKNYLRGNASHCLGHCWFVGARAAEGVAEELLDLSAHDYESEKAPAPNFESHALIHRLGGAIAYTHPCRWWWGAWGGQGVYPLEQRKFVSNLAAELPFDTVVGPTYDALDILMQTNERQVNADGQRLWFNLLNHGYRPAATASSDATFDNEGRGIPGKVRVYTQVSGPRSIAGVAEAVRRGRTFVTSGPLLLLEIDGREPGEVIVADAPVRRTARIRAWASGAPGESLTQVELVRNGESLKTFAVPGDNTEFEVEHSWMEEGDGWVIARCFGKDRNNQVAITNPVFFDRPGRKPPAPSRATVRVNVTDHRTGRPLAGICTAMEMVGRQARELFRRDIREGTLDIDVPAIARLRVESPGYAPLTKSIFLDCSPILNATLDMRVETLLDWSTFDRMRRLLSEARLDFALEMK